MARTTTRHTIMRVRGTPFSPPRYEAVGTGSITPGKLLEFESNGYVQEQSAAGAATEKLVALETPTPDSDTSTAVNVDYDDGETVYYARLMPGDVAWLWLGTGSVSKGIDFLAPDGSGNVASVGTGVSVGTSNPIGVAYEDKNATSAGSAIRCLVRIV